MKNKIREMVENDIEEVIRIIRWHDRSDGRSAARYFADYFSDPGRQGSPDEDNYVAIDQESDKIIGVSGYGPDEYNTRGIYWLGWTYVDNDFRRRGLGSALLNHVIEQVGLRGGRKLYIDTSSDPIYKAALAFYRSFGFELEGVLKDYYGGGEDYIILGKKL